MTASSVPNFFLQQVTDSIKSITFMPKENVFKFTLQGMKVLKIDSITHEITLLKLNESEIVSKSEEIENVLSMKSQRAIASAHFLASIIADFFRGDDCCSVELNAILENIFIFGGSCRSILLNVNINDIDFLINTRELCKIQFKHLQRYHSTPEQQKHSSCILWQLYLRKFSQKAQEYEKRFSSKQLSQKRLTIDYIYACNWILNCQFITEDIVFPRLKVHLKWKKITYYYACEFTDHLMYNGYDLREEEWDFLDVRKVETTQKVFKDIWMACKPDLKSLPKHNINNEISEEKQDCIPIEISIYDTTIKEMGASIDFSFDSLIIRLSDIASSKTIDFDLGPKINSMLDSSAKMNIKNKLITHLYPRYVVAAQGPCKHFFRCIKFLMRFPIPEWTFDKRILDVHVEFYSLWLKNEEYWTTKKYTEFENYGWEEFTYGWIKHLPKPKHSSVSKLNSMADAFEIMKSDKLIAEALEAYPIFKQYFITQIKKRKDEKIIIQVFQTRGYLHSL